MTFCTLTVSSRMINSMGFLYQVVDVHRVHILVVDDAEQVVQTVAAGIDDVQTVAGEMLGVEGANHDTHHHAQGEKDGHIALIDVHDRWD